MESNEEPEIKHFVGMLGEWVAAGKGSLAVFDGCAEDRNFIKFTMINMLYSPFLEKYWKSTTHLAVKIIGGDGLLLSDATYITQEMICRCKKKVKVVWDVEVEQRYGSGIRVFAAAFSENKIK